MSLVKTQRGITIIALIITVVILLILAVVAITAVEEADIIGAANNAANTYMKEQNEEQDFINDYEDILDEYGKNDKIKTLSIIESRNGSAVITITYKEGMTWEQWCNSEYNTNEEFYVTGSNLVLRKSDSYKIGQETRSRVSAFICNSERNYK